MPVVEPFGGTSWDDIEQGRGIPGIEMRGSIGTPGGFGFMVFGWTEFGQIYGFGGVYQRRVSGYNNLGYSEGLPRRTYFVLMRHSHPSNPQTATQQSWRGNFAEAMQAWHDLTEEERSEIIRKARRANRRPHNFFVSDYLRKLQ